MFGAPASFRSTFALRVVALCSTGPDPLAVNLWRRITHSDNVLLVVQTFEVRPQLLVCVPTRPSQNDPERVAAWERRRASVGSRIRKLRTDRGLTQEQLALESGVTRPIINAVENGKRGLLFERLFDIADAIGVPASELLPDD